MIGMKLISFVLILQVIFVNGHWNDEGPVGNGHGKLAALDVICGKDHMTVRAEFAGPFHGIVASKGTYGQDNCVYIKPYSGVTHATFKVYYDQCGTKPDLQGKYYENTVVIQYGTDIIEAWDEAKRLRCEWFEAYEKPATFRPAIPVADLDVVEMNFQGDDIDCWMEIQEGKGPFGREVSRIVPVGQPMTIVIAINDYGGEFDMRVKSCFAHDGVKPAIHLTDEHGCVLRPKMLTKFEKTKDPNGKATVISYAHFYAFKFPDSMNVQIQCTVEVCRHGCPDACQKTPYHHKPDRQFKQQISLSYDQRSSSSNIQSASKPQTNPHYLPPQHPAQPIEPIKESTEGQDLHRLASADAPAPPQLSQQSPAPSTSAPSSTPSTPTNQIESGSSSNIGNRFDSKRLPVYNDESAGNASSNDTASPNGDNSADSNSNETNSENTNDTDGSKDNGDEEEAASDKEETKVSKESDHQPESSSDDKKIIVPQTPHHPPPSGPSPPEPSSSPVPEGDDEKPVFVHDEDNNNSGNSNDNNYNNNDEPKESIFNKFANNNYDKAAELFKDLGVNVDIAKFASGFISGIDPNSNNQPNLGSILENDKIRDIVEASGVNLKESNHLAPQPLISGKPMRDLTDPNEEEHLNPEELSALAASSEHLTSPVPTSSYPYSLLNPKETGQQQQQQQPHPHQQQPHPASAGTQVNQNDQEKGQLSGINNINNNDNNIISNQPGLSSINSVKATNSVPMRLNENHLRRPDEEEVKHHDANTLNLNLDPSSLPPKGINLAHKNLHPEALAGLNVENPVAQVVPLPLGIGPINNFVAPKFNHLIPHHHHQQPQQQQPQGPQHPIHPLIHHPHPQQHQQKLQPPHHQQLPPQAQQMHHQQQHQKRLPMLPQRPVIIHDGVQLRPQHGMKQQRPPPQAPSNLPLHRAASLLANFAGLSNLNIPFLSSMQRQDQRQNIAPQPIPSGPITQGFPHGPRSFRTKRSSSSKPIASVKKGFQVVTSIDLDFNPNITDDLPEIHQGHREQIIYGVCLPTNGFIVSLITIISIIILSLITSFVLIRRINRSRNDGKSSFAS